MQWNFIFTSYFLQPVSFENLRNLLRRLWRIISCSCTPQWVTHSHFNIHGVRDLIFGVLPLRCYCKLAYHCPADIDNADDQTGLPLGAALVHVHQGITRGVYRLHCPCGSNIVINDWRAAMTLTWPWGSSEGSHDGSCFATTLSSVGIFVVTPQ